MVTETDTAETSPLPHTELPSEIEALGLKVTDLEEQARRLIREQPVVAVLAAAGLGYLVARLVSREGR